MSDTLLNPALPRNVRDARDISKKGKEVLCPASLCGGGDKHPDLPCLQSDSDCRNANAGKLNCGDDLFGGNPRTLFAWCIVCHTRDKLGREERLGKNYFQLVLI